MQSFSQFVTLISSTLTILMQIVTLLLAVFLVFHKFRPKGKSTGRIISFVSNNYVVLIFLIAATSTVGSLVMSDILGFLPCKLCWYQRIFMYPQVIVAGIAMLTNDSSVKKYLLPLSLIGAGIAVYHILLQMFPTVLQCGDELVSCSTNQFVGFGYITIPVMSLTAFTLMTIILLTNYFGQAKR